MDPKRARQRVHAYGILRPWWQMSGFTRTRKTDRFWRKVRKTRLPGECWEWLNGRTGSGYGAIRWQGKVRYAHDVAYELYHGHPVPPGLVVRHICDNPLCCRPTHLRLGTHAENMRDMAERGRARPGVLTDDQVIEIRRAVARRTPNREISARYNVTQRTIHRIASGRSYRHLLEIAQ